METLEERVHHVNYSLRSVKSPPPLDCFDINPLLERGFPEPLGFSGEFFSSVDFC
jgi:hypothetical protein